MSACRGCGAVLEQPRASGRRREWCSEKCRRGQYAGTCETCGAPTNGNGGPGTASSRCGGCWLADHTQTERNEKLVALWQEGLPVAEIADALDMAVSHVLTFVTKERAKGSPLARRQLTHPDSAARYRLIGTRVREGLSNDEIAAELGTSRASVAYMIYSARLRGFDIPRRKEVAV